MTPDQHHDVSPLPPVPRSLPWQVAMLILSTIVLGVLGWLCLQMSHLNSRMTASCLAHEKMRWEQDPEGMRRAQEDAAQEDARIQAELDRLRAVSWHGWLTVPKQPRGRGCED